MAKSFIKDFKVFFFRGLAAMLPMMLTLMIIIYVFRFIQENVGRHLDQATQWGVIQIRRLIYGGPWSFAGADAEWEKVQAFWDTHGLGFIGIVLAFVFIYVLGRFVASIMGRWALRVLEAGFKRLPVIRQLYPQVKQVTDYFFSDRRIEFSRVVAVEYPRKGIWALGLVTAGGMKKLAEAGGSDMLTIFIPSSPMPVTGYTITVRKDEVVDLPLSIDEAFRFTISGGVIQPPPQVTRPTKEPPPPSGAANMLPNKETQA